MISWKFLSSVPGTLTQKKCPNFFAIMELTLQLIPEV